MVDPGPNQQSVVRPGSEAGRDTSSPGSGRLERRILRKYLVTFVALVSLALLISGLVGAYFSYQENRAALGRLQREQASSAAAAIQAFLTDIDRQVTSATPPAVSRGVVPLEQFQH